jgi:hypothetical protein
MLILIKRKLRLEHCRFSVCVTMMSRLMLNLYEAAATPLTTDTVLDGISIIEFFATRIDSPVLSSDLHVHMAGMETHEMNVRATVILNNSGSSVFSQSP